MGKLEKALDRLQRGAVGVQYDDLMRVCCAYFGEPRQVGTSHAVFKTPWEGDPRVNIQKGNNGEAKAYQVRQVLAAVKRLEEVGEDVS